MIRKLSQRVHEALVKSGLVTEIRGPKSADGHWWLDATLEGHRISIEWSPRHGFGVSAVNDGRSIGYGEGHDETYETLEETADRVIRLLRAKEDTQGVPV